MPTLADPHLSLVRPVTPRAPDGCEECLILGSEWVHLRLCLTCGHVGCCDSSPLRPGLRLLRRPGREGGLGRGARDAGGARHRRPGPGRFLGELSLLTGEGAWYSAVALDAGEVLAVPAGRLRELVARDPTFGDLILRAYLLRRSILIGLGAGLRIVGSKYSPDTRRVRDFAARNRLPYRFLDLQADPSAEALLAQFGVTPQDTPVVIVHGRLLRNPGNAELAAAVGLPAPSDSSAPGEPSARCWRRAGPASSRSATSAPARPNASPPPSVRARWRSGSRSNEQVPPRRSTMMEDLRPDATVHAT